MKKALMGAMLLLATALGVCAQDDGTAPGRTSAGGNFGETSASQVTLFPAPATGSFALANPAGEASAIPMPAPTPAAPAAKPKYVFFGDRDDYRWQLGVGVEYFRFQSNIINASMVGLNTTLTYYTNSWFALEGNVVTGFAPEIYDREHVKLFGGAGGIRIGGRRAQWEPWGHALVGGAHLQPQTAGNSRSALMAQAGIGVDYRVHSRLSIRVEGDWVYTTFFSQAQNNFQGVAGVVLHF
jgi:opacity protein-like surface antigen